MQLAENNPKCCNSRLNDCEPKMWTYKLYVNLNNDTILSEAQLHGWPWKFTFFQYKNFDLYTPKIK